MDHIPSPKEKEQSRFDFCRVEKLMEFVEAMHQKGAANIVRLTVAETEGLLSVNGGQILGELRI